ncbi:molybdopterin-synthase adenylyltransferase MoeB [Herbiconiux sp. CPCC 205716]|uniref:Molybdopterin-synthase adenylyltransferase MoeB n=1 Tax=Herbiconiux gentiana TaxID=2970912 RepID=A0ABT2GGI2_9MICO|nr:molybdopterin-synthase adenylyltransferase MoeB [Herbiconiux gentiana]MCS5715338.1 molybdopterin-synthase adenylyltransferase MoeB [Herbiconiux gentiana]
MPLPALVSPGPELTRAELLRYSRQISLPHVGIDGQRRLKDARVLVLGAGGLGSPVLQYLAAAGVGTIGIADHDTVEVSNLQRQTIHPDARVGDRKVASAAAAVRAQNPLIEVIEHDAEVTPATVLELVSEYDVVVDGTDNFEVQYVVDAACALVGKPLVWGSVLRFDGQVTVFWATAGEGLDRTLDDLYPEQPDADAGETCSVAGVLGPVCAAIGAVMATETLKLLGGYGEPLLGRLLVHDALDASWREVPFGKAANRDTPGSRRTRGAANIGEPYSYTKQGAAAAGPATALFERQSTVTSPTPSVTAPELKSLLEARERGEADFVLVDVREMHENQLVAIEGSELVPLGQILSDQAREILPPQEKVIVHCHHDARSQQAAALLRANGWEDVTFVQGGIDAWSREVDPSAPRY